MKKFWIILIIIVAVCALLFALTYTVPGIKNVASELVDKKTPVWLVGLLAPILFLFRKIGDGLSNILPSSGEEEAVKKENERILNELDKINQKVEWIDTWRTQEIETQVKEIERLKQSVKNLSETADNIESNIKKVIGSDLTAGMSDEEIIKILTQKLKKPEG